MLVLACYLITEIPEHLQNLLLYIQETIRDSRWTTAANGYLRELNFDFGNLTSDQKEKLKKIVSYTLVLCVYAPSFVMIHLHSTAPEGPFLTLFQSDLLFAYSENAPDINNLVMNYYLECAVSMAFLEKCCIEHPC